MVALNSTIRTSNKTKTRLSKLGSKDESYDSIINRLLDKKCKKV